MSGYAGKLLTIDLSSGQINQANLDNEMAQNYLGGIGFNARIIADQLETNVDPLGPQNMLVFGVGTLVPSAFPTASRTEVSAKSPLTNRFGTSNSGMFFGSALKKAGYDSLIIKGCSCRPAYLLIDNDITEIKDAQDLWGLDSWAALDKLNEVYPNAHIATIGIAGENMVRYASLQNDYQDAWGRTGMGAVMGSKKLKAIVVRGNQKIQAADPMAFREIVKRAQEEIKSSPFYEAFKKYGTMSATATYGKYKATPAHNFTGAPLPDWSQQFGRETVDKYVTKTLYCQSCPIGCGHLAEIKEGKYAGLKVKALDIAPVTTFGAQCGLDTEGYIKAHELCQRLGMDIVSAGSCVAMAIELYKAGILSMADLGYSLDWGDEDGIFNLLSDIAYGKGIGKILAQGTAIAARQISGAEGYDMQIKGMEIPMIDPRGRWSTWTMGMLTNIRGGDHLRCRNPVENLKYNLRTDDLMFEKFGFGLEEYEKLDMPQELKRKIFDLDNDTVDIPLMCRWSEDLINLFNSLGVCIRPPVLNRIGPGILAEAFTCFTGIERSSRDLMKASERTWNLIKLINIREGESAEEAHFPSRFYKQSHNDQILDSKVTGRLLESYYSAREWDTHTGEPTPEKLTELGLTR